MLQSLSFLQKKSGFYQFIFILSLLHLGQLIPVNALAQPTISNTSFNPVSNVVPPQPNTAALGKYGDIPVSYYTGTPNISVPFFSLSSTQLSVPVSISYHASGLKVEEQSSYVGFGWALNAGGVVTRTVKGLPDEHPQGYVRGIPQSMTPTALAALVSDGFSDYIPFCLNGLPNTNHSPHHPDLQNAAAGKLDLEPDLFTFNFAGFSGKFVFDQQGNIHLMDHQDLIIETNLFALGYYLEHFEDYYFKITIPDGTQYHFGTNDLQGNRAYEVTISESNAECGDLDHLIQFQQTGWYLKKIVDANAIDEINLIYENYVLDEYESQVSTTIYHRMTPHGPHLPQKDCTTKIRSSVSTRVRKIIGKYGYVEFEIDTNRPRCDLSGDYPLKQASLYTNGNLLQKWVFTQSNYAQVGGGCGKLRLDAVQQIGGAGTSLPPFTFDYDAQAIPHRLSTAQDHWGYYNGADDNPHLVPQTNPSVVTNSSTFEFESCGYPDGVSPFNYVLNTPLLLGADREPNPTKMKAGMLTAINYPTGGNTTFEFESHQAQLFQTAYVPNPRLEVANTQLDPNNTGYYSVTFDYDYQLKTPLIIPRVYGSIVKECENDFDCTAYVKLTKVATNEVIFQAIDEGAFSYSLLPLDAYVGQLKLEAWHNSPSEGLATIGLEWSENDYDQPICNRMVGGLRIKSMTDESKVDPEVVTHFKYTLNSEGDCPNISSGRLLNRPDYNYIYRGYPDQNSAISIYYARSSSTTIPLGLTQGSHVGYTLVTTVRGSEAETGRTEYHFSFTPDEGTYEFPYASPSSKAIMRGNLEKTIAYDHQGVKKSETINHYEYLLQSTIYALKTAFLVSVESNNTVVWKKYKHFSYLKRLSSSSSFLDGVTTTTTYEYEPNLAHTNPIRVTMFNSDGKKHQTETDYAHEKGQNDMLTRNMVAIPLEVRKKVDDITQSGSRTVYANFDGMILPHQQWQILLGGTDLLRGTVEEYYTLTDGEGVRGFPKRFQQNFHPHAEIYRFHQGPLEGLLKSKTYGNWETTYDYDEANRLMERQTDIDGIYTTYYYDDLQRLTGLYARNGQLYQTFNYHYHLAGNNGPNAIETFSNQDNVKRFQYMDGLGRLLQTVAQKYSPQQKDVVHNAIVYDHLGRVTKAYQPANTLSNENGEYLPPAAFPPTTGFDQIEYERSPLGRETRRVFDDFGEVSMAYNSGGGINNIMSGGLYGGSELFRVDNTDENGHTTTTFTDKIGQLILTRRYEGGQNIDTYNGYDDRGNLKEVLSPMSESVGDVFSYSYDYDNRSRLLSKTLPNNIVASYTYFDHDQIKTSTENGKQLWYVYNDYLQNTYVLPEDPANPQNDAYNKAYIKQVYDNTGGTRETGKVIQSMARNLTDLNQALNTTYEYDPIGRVHSTKTDTPFGFQEFNGNVYDGGTDRIASHIHQYREYTTKEINFFDHAKRLVDQKFSSPIGGGHIAHNIYNYRDELIQKDLGVNPNGTALQSLDYQYNKRGWLTKINHLFPGQADSPINECDPVPQVEGDCENAPQIYLEELLKIRLTDDPINLNCYEECIFDPIPGTAYACDFTLQFTVNAYPRIYEIRIDHQVADLPGYPYLLQSDNGQYHYGNLQNDLYQWMLQNGYQTDGVEMTFLDQGFCLMEMKVKRSNAQAIGLLGGNQPGFNNWCNYSEGYIFQLPIDLEYGYLGEPGLYSHYLGFSTDNCKYIFLDNAPSTGTESATFPLRVYKIRLTEGTSFIITETELSQYAGAYTIEQCQTYQSLEDRIEIIANGNLLSVTLEQFLNIRKTEDLSFAQTEDCNPPPPPTCENTQRIDPNTFNGLIYHQADHPPYRYFNFSDYHTDGFTIFPYSILNNGNGALMNQTGEFEWDLAHAIDETHEVLSYKVIFNISRIGGMRNATTIGIHDGNDFLSFNGGQNQLVLDGNISLPYDLELTLDQAPSSEQVAQLRVVFFNRTTLTVPQLYAEMTYRQPCPPQNCEGQPSPCSAEQIAAQLASIEAIKAASEYLEIDALPVPNQLLRVMLCDGTPVYLFEHELAILQGNYEIVQWIGISNVNQTFSFTPQGETTPDAFAMRLYYQEQRSDQFETMDGAPQLNGNISNIYWQARGRQVQRYGYSYDELDRLKGAIYKDRLPEQSWSTDNKYTVSDISYDKNGNLLSLARRGLIRYCPDEPQYGFIDILAYQEYNGNQVGKVVDAAPEYGGVRANINGMVYDNFGNLGAHTGKNIIGSEYNHLNLPQNIYFEDGSKQIQWIYDATGRKWGKKVIENGAVIHQKEYIGGIEYTDGVLEAIYHPEGRLSTELGTEFTIRDHLGNSRVYFSDLNQDGKIAFYGEQKEVIQEQHYYPFGMNMEGEWAAQIGVENKYQYNG
ncbi:MAG: DUF6443 domain-containing protein, partial [Bacteroidota bacterium]